MKPASVIALIVAAVIIVAGIITCTVANSMANSSGNLLFAESRGDDYVKTIDLSSKELNKISLDFDDADVNIYGSSPTSYIEFVNFSETLYSLSVTNISLSFNEIPDITSMLRFWENGFSFKGMRYILNPRTYDSSKMKAINIYLSDNYDIKQFDISAKKADVLIENLSCNADFIITSDELSLYSSSVRTESMLKVNSGKDVPPAKKAKIEMDSSHFGAVSISAEELDLNGETYGMISGSVRCEKGFVNWDILHPELSSSAALPSDVSIETDGKIRVGGETQKNPFKYNSASDKDFIGFTLDISAGIADVSVTLPAYQTDEDENSADSSDSAVSPDTSN